MKELFFGRFVNKDGESVYRLTLEVKENHYLVIETYDDNYKCDMYFSDRNTVNHPKGTVFYFAPCKWGNNHGVMLKRKLKLQFNSRGELIRTEYPIVDTPKTIRKTMLKWATQYISRRYQGLCA